MIECTGNNDKNIYWPRMSRGHYRECMARTYVGTFSLCRFQKEYYKKVSHHTIYWLLAPHPPTLNAKNALKILCDLR